MTLNNLASMIAKKEGKKSQARIGDIREIIKILINLEAEELFLEKSESPQIKTSIIFDMLISKAADIEKKLLDKEKKQLAKEAKKKGK